MAESNMLNVRRKLLILTSVIICLVFGLVYAAAPVQFVITGLTGDLLTNTTERLTSAQKSFGTLGSDHLAAFQEKVPEEVAAALAPYGYFHPKVQSRLIRQNNALVLQVNIKLGPATHIQTVHIVLNGPGKQDDKVIRFLNNIALKKGQIFNSPLYEKTKDDLLQLLNERGFIKANYTQSEVFIDREKRTARIILIIETGKRYYFGKFHFETHPYDDGFLHAFIPFGDTDAFSSQKLINLQQEMTNSYYFDRVNMSPQFDKIEDYQVPVVVAVKPPRPRRYAVGLGFGTFTGPRLSAGLNLRHITDTGQHFDAQLRLSRVLSGLAAKYYIPGKNPLRDRWIIGANYQRFLPKNGESSAWTLSAGYTTHIHHYKLGGYVNYLLERYAVNNNPSQTQRMLYPSFNVAYAKADDMINPKNGKSFNFTLQAASQAIASSTSFIQGDLRGKYIVSPFDFARLILRGEIGYTVVKDLSKLPLTMQFFAGGLNSIRGFQDSSIGPGRYLKIMSAEYQNKIYGNLSGAVFYDQGIADNDFSAPLNKAVGVGIVYSSPIGPFKLYLAQAISKPSRPYGVELSIGPEF